jgi:putative membrane protein
MNNEEEDMAGLLHSKAGDNQALTTLSDTLKGDHKANQAAVKALADQKKVKLESYKKNATEYDKLSNLSGSDFNNAFFAAAIKDHRQALTEFERAKDGENDRDVKVYIDQTLPVLQAHLKMAENLRRDSEGSSSENPTNNRAENSKR